MAKLDRAKELIGFLKAIFILAVAINSSLVALLFNHPDLNLYSILVIIGIVITLLVIILLFKYILKKIVELEDIGS